jgi:hypothetical protein
MATRRRMSRGLKRKRKKPSSKPSRDSSDDSSYSLSQSPAPSEEEPLKDEEEDEIPVESQGNELEEFSQEFDLDDYDDIFPHDELSTNVEGEEGGTEDSDSLSARKEEFYKALDAKIYEQSKNNNSHAHIICDNVFQEIYSLMLSLQGAEEQERLKLLRKIPNKVGYKWEKKYDILTVDTSHILIFKQENGEALDSCKKVVSYGRIFDVLRQIHELDAGNDHPKAKTLFKRVTAKYGKSIPRWACEMFPRFCPVCIRSRPRKKAKAGHQPLLTRGMNVRAQIDLIDYQSMPDGPFQYVLDYQDHGIKFCQLRPLTSRTHRAVAIELIQIFCIFGPPSILQADNGKEFCHGASKSRRVVLDEEVCFCVSCLLSLLITVTLTFCSSALALSLRSKDYGRGQCW